MGFSLTDEPLNICKSCGAVLPDAPGNSDSVKCEYCGTRWGMQQTPDYDEPDKTIGQKERGDVQYVPFLISVGIILIAIVAIYIPLLLPAQPMSMPTSNCTINWNSSSISCANIFGEAGYVACVTSTPAQITVCGMFASQNGNVSTWAIYSMNCGQSACSKTPSLAATDNVGNLWVEAALPHR